jgi:hypothetical protein
VSDSCIASNLTLAISRELPLTRLDHEVMARKRRTNARGEVWSDDGLCCGIRRCSGGRALGSRTRRSQLWDRLRVSGLHRRARLCATRLLRSAPGLLLRTLCQLRTAAATAPASLSSGTSLSSLLLLLLISPWPAGSALPPTAFAIGYDSRYSPVPTTTSKTALNTPTLARSLLIEASRKAT